MMVLALSLGLAQAGVTVEPAPQVGVASTWTFSDEAGSPRVGVTVRAVPHPGLGAPEDAGAGITDSKGRVVWTPEIGGVTALYQGDTALGVVHVAWSPPPWSGMVPWLVILVVGLGATTVGLGYPRTLRS